MSHQLPVEDAVLDVLSADDESPWIVHAELVRAYGLEVDVKRVIAILEDLVGRGWAESHHPESPTKAFWKEALAEYANWLGPAGYARERSYFQDYGPWYRLTRNGRRAWKRRVASK